MRGRSLSLLAASVIGCLGLAGACTEQVRAPSEPGVCYAITRPDGELLFSVVARDQPQLEFCAARLEEMRLRFLRMGGSMREVVGTYQGQFIFVDARGVSTSRTLDGVRFFALARTGDGRLAVPGTIQRDIDELAIVSEADSPTFPPPPAG